MGRAYASGRRLPWLALLLACTPILTGGAELRDNFAVRITAAHNRERASLGIARLVWSEKLAGEAAVWARHLSEVGYLAHSEDEPDDPDPSGENLWAGTRDSYSVEQMIDFWTAERAHFHPGRFPDNSDTGEIEDIGHYTQVIWRGTTKVGCAIADNGQDEYLVCRYHEGGNVMGESPY